MKQTNPCRPVDELAVRPLKRGRSGSTASVKKRRKLGRREQTPLPEVDEDEPEEEDPTLPNETSESELANAGATAPGVPPVDDPAVQNDTVNAAGTSGTGAVDANAEDIAADIGPEGPAAPAPTTASPLKPTRFSTRTKTPASKTTDKNNVAGQTARRR